VKNILAVIAMIMLTGSGVVTALEHQGPRIEIREVRHDFGRVVQGTQVAHVFEVRSVGDEALVIERVTSS
jgi:hypothetical protein